MSIYLKNAKCVNIIYEHAIRKYKFIWCDLFAPVEAILLTHAPRMEDILLTLETMVMRPNWEMFFKKKRKKRNLVCLQLTRWLGFINQWAPRIFRIIFVGRYTVDAVFVVYSAGLSSLFSKTFVPTRRQSVYDVHLQMALISNGVFIQS